MKITKNKLCFGMIFFLVVLFCSNTGSTFQNHEIEIEVEKAKALINLAEPDKDKVQVKGEFWLAPTSDDIRIATNREGLRVLNDKVTVKFARRHEFYATFLAGSLVEVKPKSNKFVYKLNDSSRSFPGIVIKYAPGSYQGKFSILWNHLDLVAQPGPTIEDVLLASDPSSGQPVDVGFDLDIGNDNGVVDGINFKLTREKRDTIQYEFVLRNNINDS